MVFSIKTPEEIAKMRVASLMASEVLDLITEHVVPGVTTDELNTICHKHIVDVQVNVERRALRAGRIVGYLNPGGCQTSKWPCSYGCRKKWHIIIWLAKTVQYA